MYRDLTCKALWGTVTVFNIFHISSEGEVGFFHILFPSPTHKNHVLARKQVALSINIHKGQKIRVQLKTGHVNYRGIDGGSLKT